MLVCIIVCACVFVLFLFVLNKSFVVFVLAFFFSFFVWERQLGSGPNDHEGNVRFRQYVAARKAEYLATNHRLTKAKIAREIVDQVFARQGRFLKKMEADDLQRAGLSEGTDAWMGVDDDTIMEKAKQALRQNTNKKNSGAGATTTTTTSATASSCSSTTSSAQSGQQHQPPQHQPKLSSAHVPLSYEPIPLDNSVGPAMVSHSASQMPYVLDDLEPIPLRNASTTTTPPTHVQRPSQIAMPPPVAVRTEWQMQQRQQIAQQRMNPDAQFSGGVGMNAAAANNNNHISNNDPSGGGSNLYHDNGDNNSNDNMAAYMPRGMMQPQRQTGLPEPQQLQQQ